MASSTLRKRKRHAADDADYSPAKSGKKHVFSSAKPKNTVKYSTATVPFITDPDWVILSDTLRSSVPKVSQNWNPTKWDEKSDGEIAALYEAAATEGLRGFGHRLSAAEYNDAHERLRTIMVSNEWATRKNLSDVSRPMKKAIESIQAWDTQDVRYYPSLVVLVSFAIAKVIFCFKTNDSDSTSIAVRQLEIFKFLSTAIQSYKADDKLTVHACQVTEADDVFNSFHQRKQRKATRQRENEVDEDPKEDPASSVSGTIDVRKFENLQLWADMKAAMTDDSIKVPRPADYKTVVQVTMTPDGLQEKLADSLALIASADDQIDTADWISNFVNNICPVNAFPALTKDSSRKLGLWARGLRPLMEEHSTEFSGIYDDVNQWLIAFAANQIYDTTVQFTQEGPTQSLPIWIDHPLIHLARDIERQAGALSERHESSVKVLFDGFGRALVRYVEATEEDKDVR